MNANMVVLVGRLTRDAELKTFQSGGKVANIGFATTGSSRKDAQTGQWSDVPMYIDLKAFCGAEKSGMVDRLGVLTKGTPLYVQGHLELEQWEDKNGGGKRSKHVVVVDKFQYLAPKGDGQAAAPASNQYAAKPAPGAYEPASYNADDPNIPF